MALSSALIWIFSVALITYWFRYTCRLLLRAGHDEFAELAQARSSHLNFPEIRSKLQSSGHDVIPASLHELLERDYQVLCYLVRHTSHSNVKSLETRLLMADYRLMQLWYLLTLHTVHSQARRALEEMIGIVGYMSRKIDAHAASLQEA